VSNQALWITCLIGPLPCPRRPGTGPRGTRTGPRGTRTGPPGTRIGPRMPRGGDPHCQLPVTAARSFSTCFAGIASRSVAAV
jgi:hypothetical protein